jgi:integrase
MRRNDSPDKSPHVERDYLRPDEANAVIDAAGRVGRQRLRDQVLLSLMYRHGLRASEAKHTKWSTRPDARIRPEDVPRPSAEGIN